MKKKIIISMIAVFSLVFQITPINAATNLASKMRGKILLQVESKGEAWYINPNDDKRYYMGRPEDAFALMRRLGTGISNINLSKIKIGDKNLINSQDSDNDGLSDMIEDAIGTNKLQKDSDQDGKNDKEEILSGNNPIGSGYLKFDSTLASKFSGKILLQVESHGEAWYVYPGDNKRYFLGRPADAFRVMRELGLGISNVNLLQIIEASGLSKEETILKMAMEKMDNLKTASFDGDITAGLNIDTVKIPNITENQELIQTLYTFTGNRQSGQINFKYNFSGSNDQTNIDSPKGQASLDMAFIVNGTEMKMSMETKKIAEKTYLKFSQLSFPFSMIFGPEFDNQWVVVDNPENPLVVMNQNELKEAQNKITEMMFVSKMILVKQISDKYIIDGQEHYIFNVSLTANLNSEDLSAKIISLYQKNGLMNFKTETERQEFEDFIKLLVKTLSKTNANYYIRKNDLLIKNADFNFIFDMADFSIINKQSNIPPGVLILSVKGKIEYFNFNSPVLIEIPANIKSMTELMEISEQRMVQ